jgi:hypothetical protein
MEWNDRLNAEISQSGTKKQSFRRKLKDYVSAICRDCFDADIGVRYVRRVEWSGKSV